MPKLIVPFRKIQATRLIQLSRLLGGIDYWPVPLKGNLPRPYPHELSPQDLVKSWNGLYVDETVADTMDKLYEFPSFGAAYDAFHQAVCPDIRQHIRYFRIVVSYLHIYLIEMTDPSMMGLANGRTTKKATDLANKLLTLVRSGVHFGTLGINENRQLALSLELFVNEVGERPSVRHTESLQERRFIKGVIREFLVAYGQPMPTVLFHLCRLIGPVKPHNSDDTLQRSIQGYITGVKAELARAKPAAHGTWHTESK